MKSLSTHISESFTNESKTDWENLEKQGIAKNVGYKGSGEYLEFEKNGDDWEAAYPDNDWPLVDAKEKKSDKAFVMSEEGWLFHYDKKQGFDKFKKAVEKFMFSGKIKDLTSSGFVEVEEAD